MRKTTVVVLCGGNEERWGNYLDVRKHLIDIEGEALLDRTLRLLNELLNNATIYVVYPRLLVPSVKIDYPNVYCVVPMGCAMLSSEADKFYSSSFLWERNGRTIILFGDVWYSSKAMQAIVGNRSYNWRVFGRQQGSYFTSCSHGELFAWSFYSKDISSFLSELIVLHYDYYQQGVNIACGWGHHNIRNGMEWLMKNGEINRGHASFKSFVHIDDFTDDFDKPKDYHCWIEAKEKWDRMSAKGRFITRIRTKLRIVFYQSRNMFYQIVSAN